MLWCSDLTFLVTFHLPISCGSEGMCQCSGQEDAALVKSHITPDCCLHFLSSLPVFVPLPHVTGGVTGIS